ncbi:MAG TPA: hypothetical protein VGL42_07700 [Opitutaceae bacterium]
MSSRTRIIALTACLVVLVLGCRWGVEGRFGTDIPEEDEWDAEGFNLFVARAHHNLHLSNFLEMHVDHHVLLTRVLAYVETTANGWWDQRLETAVNAGLAAVLAAGFFLGFASGLSRTGQCLWFLALAAAYAVPWATDNVLRGFHSQQLFLVGLALVTFAWPDSWPGWVAAGLALGSMASGFFAAVFAAGWLVVRRRRLWPSLLIYLAIIGVALAIQTSMPATQALKARSVAEFFQTLLQSVGWPAFSAPFGYGALLLYLPWIWLTLRTLRRRDEINSREVTFIVLLGAWSLAQSLAAAYARGWGGLPPPTRYLDNVLVGLLANALSLRVLLKADRTSAEQRPTIRGAAGLWTTIVVVGLISTWPGTWAAMEKTGRIHSEMGTDVRAYLATGDRSQLKEDALPYPTVDGSQLRLNLTELRPLYPPSIHTPPAREPFGSRMARFLDSAGFVLATLAGVSFVVLLLL